VKVDLGCGPQKKSSEYVGVDLNKYENVDYVVDVSKEGLPFRNGEVDEIFTSHFLEHIENARIPFVLSECYRVLKQGGEIEILVPDLLDNCKAFLEAEEENRWEFLLMTIYGQQINPGEFHKTGFSKKRLMSLITQVGFWPEVCLNVLSHQQTCILLKASRR
jgi:ubiquinone/menaquinone biosynthesis C-methylase UbiE